MNRSAKKILASCGITAAIVAGMATPAGAQESARPGNPWAGSWQDAKPLTPQDPGFWNFGDDNDRIISPKGNNNVQCYNERWATGGCRQDGRELPQLATNGWRGIFINDPALEKILLPASDVIQFLVNTSAGSSSS